MFVWYVPFLTYFSTFYFFYYMKILVILVVFAYVQAAKLGFGVWTYMKSSVDNIVQNVFQEISKFIFDIFFFAANFSHQEILLGTFCEKRKLVKCYLCLIFLALESKFLIKDTSHDHHTYIRRAIEQEPSFTPFHHIV